MTSSAVKRGLAKLGACFFAILVVSATGAMISMSAGPAVEKPKAEGELPPAADRKVEFGKDIQAILAKNCYFCHGPEMQRASLRLDV